LYDQDGDLKKQLDALLKREEQLQKEFDEKEEALGDITRSALSLRSVRSRDTLQVPFVNFML
jgi:hypothetical protein